MGLLFPPSKKPKKSTTTFWVSLRPFGGFRGFSGFLRLKSDFGSASVLFRSPFFSFLGLKLWCTFRISLRKQRTPKRYRQGDSNQTWCTFRVSLRCKEQQKVSGWGDLNLKNRVTTGFLKNHEKTLLFCCFCIMRVGFEPSYMI